MQRRTSLRNPDNLVDHLDLLRTLLHLLSALEEIAEGDVWNRILNHLVERNPSRIHLEVRHHPQRSIHEVPGKLGASLQLLRQIRSQILRTTSTRCTETTNFLAT